MALALVKSLLLLGAVLLIGGGVTVAVVAPELAATGGALRRRVLWGAAVGAGLLLLGSALDIVLTLRAALGRFPSFELLVSYLSSTRHGQATLYRFVLVALVFSLTLALDRGAAHRRAPTSELMGVYFGLSLFLLGTFSYTSHAAATGGAPPLVADLAHFAAATVWAGPLFYLALSDWRDPYQKGLQAAFRRVSATGLGSVVTLFATGIYATLVHLQDPVSFATSPYGFVLYAKVFLVLVIVGLAAFNRFWLLPAFLQGSAQQFRRVVRTEGVLLVTVFLATGVLTTSALPHGDEHTSAWTNLVNLIQTLQGD